MKLFHRKRRHGKRSSTSPRPTRVRRDSRQLSRRWHRHFRKLLRMQNANRRVTKNADGSRLSPSRELFRTVGCKLGHALAFVAIAALAAAIPLGLWVGYDALLDAPHFFLREVEVTGNERVAAATITAAGGFDAPVSTLTIDEEEAVAAITSLPWIRKAEVEVVLPGLVKVTVEERKARAILAMDANYLVDETVALFASVRPEDHAELPILTGFERRDFTDAARQSESRRRLHGALVLFDLWKELGLAARLPLSKIECHGVYGYIAHLRDDDVELWLGTKGFRKKLARAADVIADVNKRDGQLRRVYLDADNSLERVVVETDAGERTDDLAHLGVQRTKREERGARRVVQD